MAYLVISGAPHPVQTDLSLTLQHKGGGGGGVGGVGGGGGGGMTC